MAGTNKASSAYPRIWAIQLSPSDSLHLRVFCTLLVEGLIQSSSPEETRLVKCGPLALIAVGSWA